MVFNLADEMDRHLAKPREILVFIVSTDSALPCRLRRPA
jgi:hypothetical protein